MVSAVVAMDEIDRKIIEMLREDGRVKFTKMAATIEVPEATVRYRVKSMLKEGVIRRFTVELSRFGILCFVFAKADPKVDLAEICEQILRMDNVEFTYEITGDYDCVALIREKSPQDLNRLIDEIRSIPGVINTSSNLVLREHR